MRLSDSVIDRRVTFIFGMMMLTLSSTLWRVLWVDAFIADRIILTFVYPILVFVFVIAVIALFEVIGCYSERFTFWMSLFAIGILKIIVVSGLINTFITYFKVCLIFPLQTS